VSFSRLPFFLAYLVRPGRQPGRPPKGGFGLVIIYHVDVDEKFNIRAPRADPAPPDKLISVRPALTAAAGLTVGFHFGIASPTRRLVGLGTIPLIPTVLGPRKVVVDGVEGLLSRAFHRLALSAVFGY